jgi:hypothetical protein
VISLCYKLVVLSHQSIIRVEENKDVTHIFIIRLSLTNWLTDSMEQSPSWNPKVHYRVRFKVLTAASIKSTAFRDIAPCILVEVYRRFRGADGSSKLLWNVGKLLSEYKAQYSRRQPSSCPLSCSQQSATGPYPEKKYVC